MRLLSVFGFFGVACGLATCPNTQTCNLNVMCTLNGSQLPSGIRTTCQSTSTVVPCSTCQQCVGAPECTDSLFFCDYLTAAQAQALPASHPCLSTACQLNKNSPTCMDSTYKYCCIPGTPNCNQTTSAPACTPSGCSYFMNQQTSTPNYTAIACPFQNATATCKLAQCNTTMMFQQIVNSFAGSISCSGAACFSSLIPPVCAAGVNLTSSLTPNYPACTNYLVDYCIKNPTDPGCIKSCPYNCNAQDNCPCNSTACQAVNQAPICVRTAGACASFRSMLINAMFLQRNFQPLSDSLVYSKNYAGPPVSPFQWNSTLLSAKDNCSAVVAGLGDQITTCVQTSFLYCNAHPWDPACQTELSVCGDGIVSWFETCDEGSLPPSGGCVKCKTASNWECYQQNTTCKRCIHQTGWVIDGQNPNICPFCYGLVSSTPWPCATTSPCAKTTTLAQKSACDDYVKTYCAAIAANSNLRDPGCDTYVNSTKSFTVPTIPQACEYSIKTIAINDPQLFSLKFAIFNCSYANALNSKKNSTTPKYYFQNPLDTLSSDTLNTLSSQASLSLNAIYGNKTTQLYSLQDLVLSDFNPYVDPNIVINGVPLTLKSSIAKLTLFQSALSTTSPQCSALPFDTNLMILPPSKHPLKWALKSYLYQLRYNGINNNDATLANFADLNVDNFSTDAYPVGGVFQAAVLLSQSSQDASGAIQETRQKTCTKVNGNTVCLNIESSLTNGLAALHFDRNLFDDSCTDVSCAFPVDPCRMVRLVKKSLRLNPSDVQLTSNDIVKYIGNMDNAISSTNAKESFLQIAMAASNEVYSDTVALISSLVTTGQQIVLRKNVPKYCPKNQYVNSTLLTLNPSWASDPCCNPAVAQYMCCAPQDVPSGVVTVVTGFDSSLVSTYCPNSNKNQMLGFLNGVFSTMQSIENSVKSLDDAIQTTSWSTLSNAQQICSSMIFNASDIPCSTDKDCSACSKSLCSMDPQTNQGTCTVPFDDIIGCTAECLSNTMDPILLRFFKDALNLTVRSTAQDFTSALSSQVSVQQCVGPYASRKGIGLTQKVYTCNSTCQQSYMCDDNDYISYLRSNTDQQLDFNQNATCLSNGGRVVCTGYADNTTCNSFGCTFDSVNTSCKLQYNCMNQCMLPSTKGGCILSGGTWYMDQYNNNQCCPADANYNSSNPYSPCSYSLPNAPDNPYQITNPICCAARNGTWFVVGNQGSCCFGKVTTVINNNVPQLGCVTTVSSWDFTSCLKSCDVYKKGCTACKRQNRNNNCCSYQVVPANQTACLEPQICSNRQLSPSSCNDSTPFCAKCSGNFCTSVTRPATCTYNVYSSSACSSAGGTWSNRTCFAITGSIVQGSDCLRADICPSTTNFSAYYASQVPLYPQKTILCQRGCYLPSVTKTTCESTSNYAWLSNYANGSGICLSTNTKTLSACTSLSGTFLNATIAYYPGAFTTEEQCAQGSCIGSPTTDGWSQSQCLNTSTWSSCTEACTTCAVPTSSPFASQNSSACFSTDASYCSSLGYSAAPCVNPSATTSDACTALTSTVWKSCSSYSSQSTCTNSTDTYASMLGCQWSTSPCRDAASCAAQGSCTDIDNNRRVCYDDGWTFGDTCTATRVQNITKSSAVSTTTSTFTCKNCRTYNGVCVAPVNTATGCSSQDKWHPMGCRVYGIYNSTACTAASGVWYTRATTKTDCMSYQGCLEPGSPKLSSKSASECSKCGGTLKSRYKWTPGSLVRPFVDAYTWQANGSVLISANQYKSTLSTQLLTSLLQGPIARRVAMYQKTKALMMYNGMSDTLNRLACACGVNAATNCFSQATSSSSSLTGQTTVFCGNDTTSIPTGSGTAVVSMTCPASRRRRLDTSSLSSQISFSQYSIASYNQMWEPYCTSNAQNPLAITSTSGLIYGQLLGPGQGIMSSSSFNNISICLSIDPNIRQWPAFDTLDVGILQSNAIVPTNTASFSVANGAQLCFSIMQNGVYFPIRRANGATSSSTCSMSCNSKGGSCVYNATTQQSECLCNCGYSGSLCEKGCLNGCSGQGTCYQGSCYCNTGFAGTDCSNFNCPVDSSNRPCFNNGVCTSTGCVCNANYQGTACDTPSFALLNGSAPQDFVSNYVASTTSVTLPPGWSTPSPTLASAGSSTPTPTTTSAPTTTAVKTPTPTKGSCSTATPLLLLQLLLALMQFL